MIRRLFTNFPLLLLAGAIRNLKTFVTNSDLRFVCLKHHVSIWCLL